MPSEPQSLTPFRALIWIFCLAFLSVGLRNFEVGISIDGPLYATIARNIAQTGEWFRLYGNVPDFEPFAEHPHLGFWLWATVFKVLPIEDWAARTLGHLYYVGFMWMLFLYVRSIANEKVAAWSVVILWAFSQFSNFFSNIYLDPGCLFFGVASVFLFELSLRKSQMFLCVLSGVCLALSTLYKGLTVVGFLPVYVVILILAYEKPWRRLVTYTALSLFSSFIVFLAYYLAIRSSSIPNFLELYWQNQVTNRFAQDTERSSFFNKYYWIDLQRHTHYLAPLVVISLIYLKKGKRILIPLTLLITFNLIFAMANRVGGQYMVMVLPWIAWLLAEVFATVFPASPRRLAGVTTAFCILGVFVVQYLPFRTHAARPSTAKLEIRKLSDQKAISHVILDIPLTPNLSFVTSSSYAWYGNVDVDYYISKNKIPDPNLDTGYLIHHYFNTRTPALRQKGWCPYERFKYETLWLSCDHKRVVKSEDGSTPSGS